MRFSYLLFTLLFSTFIQCSQECPQAPKLHPRRASFYFKLPQLPKAALPEKDPIDSYEILHAAHFEKEEEPKIDNFSLLSMLKELNS